MIIQKLTFRPLATAALVSLALTACSSAPKQNASLEQARAAYEKASQDVTLVRHAPEELDKANVALKTADWRWKKGEKPAEVEHFAYLASQRVRIAEQVAKSNEMDRELADMALARRSVTLDLREAELQKVKQEALDLQKQMDALQAEKTERGMVLTLGDVLFESNQATMAPGAARNISKIAEFMSSNPKRHAVIEGHTDSMGDDDYNMDLSRDRAFAIRRALINEGIPGSRISTQGFGETLPVASNSTSAGRQKNRRVEIIFPDLPTQVTEYED